MSRFTIEGRYVRDNDTKKVYTSLYALVEVLNSIEFQRSMFKWEAERSRVNHNPIAKQPTERVSGDD